MVSSLRATATRATRLGFPAATSLSRKAFSTGLQRLATMAPMNRAERTEARPPPIRLLPFHWPDLKLTRPKGALLVATYVAYVGFLFA